MKKAAKILIFIILALSIIKSIFSYLIGPTIFTDEYIYLKMSQSFFSNLNFNIHELNIAPYPPLYPILLSISFLFSKSVIISYTIMKIINSIVSTLIIIPAYLISKEFIEKNKALLISFIIAIMPMNFSLSPYLMSENLFYTLYLFTIYFIYKTFSKNSIKYGILAGIFLSLAVMSRILGISLVTIVIGIFLIKIFKKQYNAVKLTFTIGISSLIAIMPWLIRNALIYGFTLHGIMGQYSVESNALVNQNSIITIAIWFLIYLAYIIIASGFIGAASWINAIKKKSESYNLIITISIISLLFLVLSAANHTSALVVKENTPLELTGRPIGRYIETALPLIMILGMINLNTEKKLSNKILLSFIPILLAGSQLFFFPLFPINNSSLTLFGIFNEIISKITIHNVILSTILIILIITLILIVNSKYKIKNNMAVTAIILFLIISSISSYAVSYYSYEKNWKNNPQIKLSEWISKNIDENKTILIDEDYCGIVNKENINNICSPGKSVALIGLWVWNPIKIDKINENEDYIITKKSLNLEIVKKTENNIYLYKNEIKK